MRILVLIFMSFFALGLAGCQTLPSPPISQAMTPGMVTPAPFGFVAFCERHAEDCQKEERRSKTVRLSPEKWNDLQEVNWDINTKIIPVTDTEHYQQIEYWAYPSSAGDCEDYALAKRKALMERGWPAHSLLLSVAIEEAGTAHAVLIATTEKGDFVLDNQTLDILPWNETNYLWEKRQSQEDPMMWVELENNQSLAGLSSASILP